MLQAQRNYYFFQNHKIKVVGLVETRVKEHKALSTVKKITPGWKEEFNNSKAENGIVCILWDNNAYEVYKLDQEAQFINSNVVNRQLGLDCEMTIIYCNNPPGYFLAFSLIFTI